jgi:demethylmenaquinone methyltransferase / 2-methoxy-6-polyprenyl-1,4-benzoquinol methylase
MFSFDPYALLAAAYHQTASRLSRIQASEAAHWIGIERGVSLCRGLYQIESLQIAGWLKLVRTRDAMTNRFYHPGEQRASKVNDLFATVARRYDLMNDLQSFGLHRVWKSRLVRWANPRPGERALDLCCGTGDLAFALARRGASVVGLDFSDAMLQVARNRSRKFENIQRVPPAGSPAPPVFIRGDAQQIPYPDDSFDMVTVAYGLRNLADWQAGLREMQRVAKPGGRVLVLDFGKPDNRVWREAYFCYLRTVVPALGGWICGDADAYSYILESLLHFVGQRGVAAKMNELGLTGVRTLLLLGGIMGINCGQKPGGTGASRA